jgi:hypothetical protein
MFWGCEVSQGQDHTVTEKEVMDDEFGQSQEMLHVSNASLNVGKKAQDGTKYKVFVHVHNAKHLLANLSEGGVENYALDLYFRNAENPKFTVESKGTATVSITGYWEMAPDMMEDDEFGMGPMDMDMLEEEENADLEPAIKGRISKFTFLF